MPALIVVPSFEIGGNHIGHRPSLSCNSKAAALRRILSERVWRQRGPADRAGRGGGGRGRRDRTCGAAIMGWRRLRRRRPTFAGPRGPWRERAPGTARPHQRRCWAGGSVTRTRAVHGSFRAAARQPCFGQRGGARGSRGCAGAHWASGQAGHCPACTSGPAHRMQHTRRRRPPHAVSRRRAQDRMRSTAVVRGRGRRAWPHAMCGGAGGQRQGSTSSQRRLRAAGSCGGASCAGNMAAADVCVSRQTVVVWYQMLLWAPSGIGARAQGWRGGHGLRCRGVSRVS